METNEYLAQMAALVREDPNITVREIAKQLQFADGKSVYYWLNKANYRGLGSFKQDILRENPRTQQGMRIEQDGRSLYLLSIPLRCWNSHSKAAPQDWYHLFYPKANPRGLYAVKLTVNSFSPWFLPGDMLIIDTQRAPGAAEWIVIQQGRTHSIGRMAAASRTVLHPSTLTPLDLSNSARIVGAVQQVIRSFS